MNDVTRLKKARRWGLLALAILTLIVVAFVPTGYTLWVGSIIIVAFILFSSFIDYRLSQTRKMKNEKSHPCPHEEKELYYVNERDSGLRSPEESGHYVEEQGNREG